MGVGVYVLNRGDKTGGLVLQKVSNTTGDCRLMMQQRDLYGVMIWTDALGAAIVTEIEADAYVKRAIDRDPDLWVVEIEDRAMENAMVISGR